ncbi:hypothetical protein GGR50DRAFT_691691 [Xylaria sp. CBS 124048]|nr:hypothetical protein GGR50DRAFT_691691 [Xylaria sp. CBS 124048]
MAVLAGGLQTTTRRLLMNTPHPVNLVQTREAVHLGFYTPAPGFVPISLAGRQWKVPAMSVPVHSNVQTTPGCAGRGDHELATPQPVGRGARAEAIMSLHHSKGDAHYDGLFVVCHRVVSFSEPIPATPDARVLRPSLHSYPWFPVPFHRLYLPLKVKFACGSQFYQPISGITGTTTVRLSEHLVQEPVTRFFDGSEEAATGSSPAAHDPETTIKRWFYGTTDDMSEMPMFFPGSSQLCRALLRSRGIVVSTRLAEFVTFFVDKLLAVGESYRLEVFDSPNDSGPDEAVEEAIGEAEVGASDAAGSLTPTDYDGDALTMTERAGGGEK